MRHSVPLLWVSLSLLLSGCGSGPATSSSNYPNLTGNWSFTAQTTFADVILGGSITNTGGNVSGTIHVLSCLSYPVADIPITGTVSAAGVLSATNGSSSPAVAIGGTVTGGVLSNGSYTMAELCALPNSGPLLGFLVPSYSNTYTGNLSSASGQFGTTIVATQSGPDSNGYYSLTGTALFSGSPCFASGTITGSQVSGSFVNFTITANNGSLIAFSGSLTDSTGKTITGSYQVTSGSCSGDSGSGNLSHS